jgi:hypothetical protein
MKLKNELLLLIILWAIVQSILLFKNGIVTDGESLKYIQEARTFISTGHLSSANFWLYSVQIFLLLVAFKLNLGFVFVVIVQFIVSLWATIALYRYTATLFSRAAAMTATAIFLLTYPLQEFNTFLQTESLFYSITLLFSTWLLQLNRLTIKNVTIILLVLVVISLTRPTGILFLPCTFLYLFFRFFQSISISWKVLIVSAVTVLCLFLMNMAVGSGGELDFMLPYRDERIICGVPTLHHFVDIKTAGNGNSLYGLFYYITHNLEQFSRMALRRTVAFFGLLRSYYSTGHNVFLAVFFYPVYVFVLVSIGYWFKRKSRTLLYLASVVLANWATVILTCDDWHNRFFLTTWPFLIILSLPVINNLFAKFAPNDKNPSV